MSSNHENLWAIDLDQTVFDSDLFFDATAEVCLREGITGGKVLHEDRKMVEASGGTFDTFGHLSQAGATEEELDHVANILGKNEAGIDYLYPDTHEFLETLDALGDPWLTVTWGALRTQMPKLQATELDKQPYLITDIKKKGELIQSWKTDNGYRVVTAAGQILTGSSVMLEDDKAASFTGLPEDCSGHLIQRRAPKASQLGKVPEKIKKVPNLAALTDLLRKEMV